MALRLLAIASALAAAGCGESQAEKFLKEYEAQCLAYVGKTVREAETAEHNAYVVLRCLPGEDSGAAGERLRRIAGDVCDHKEPSLCDLGWCYYSTDSRGCGDHGCWYGCGARVVPKDENGDGFLDGDTVICASRFTSGQPGPPYCP